MNQAIKNSQNFFELGQFQMKSGQYFFAKENLMRALDLGGDKLEISIDIASCMYITEDFESFCSWTQKAYIEYQNNKHHLSPSLKISVCLKLGKLLEEIGRMSNALSLYEETFSPTTIKDQIRIQKINSQRLRIYCFLGDRNRMVQLYWHLEKQAVTDQDSEIEIQHALMKADLILGSYLTAEERVLRAKQKWTMSEEHQQWIIFELLYSTLAKTKAADFNKNLLTEFNYSACGNFERIVWDIYLLALAELPATPLSLSRIEGLSIMCTLRILDLLLKLNLMPERRNEIIQKAFVYLSLIDAGSRNLILVEFNLFKLNSITPIEDQNILFTQNESKFISIFKNRKSVSFEEVSEIIYETPFNFNILNRMKVLISGLNKKIALNNGHVRSFQIRNSEIHCTIDIPKEWNK